MTASPVSRPFRVLVIPGDGIGQEVIPAALAVLRATGLPFEFVPAEAGWGCFERHGTSLPDETLAAARAADVILFGAVASPSHPVAGYRSPIVALRRALDLYANIRPARTENQEPRTGAAGAQSPALGSRFSVLGSPPVDLVVVRENTEGLYAGQETNDGETAVAKRIITRRASERIARVAFELARSRATTDHRPLTTDLRDKVTRRQGDKVTEAGETVTRSPVHPFTLSEQSVVGRQSSVVSRRSPRVTIVHKANVLRETCGLFRAVALGVAEQYPDVGVDELLVDTAALQLVQRPERFDVIVTTNLFGDILSDVASYWGGGMGMASSANLGDQHALFEPVHGAAPDIAGQGIANPLAAIGCAALLLEHLGRPRTENQEPRTDNGGGVRLDAPTDPQLSEACLMWAGRVRAAVRTVLAGEVRTLDLGGTARTEDVTKAVIDSLT